jgi:hypothetical protein
LRENGYNGKSLVNFFDFLNQQKKKIVLRAHNGIKFDLSFVRKHLVSKLLAKNLKPKVIGN